MWRRTNGTPAGGSRPEASAVKAGSFGRAGIQIERASLKIRTQADIDRREGKE